MSESRLNIIRKCLLLIITNSANLICADNRSFSNKYCELDCEYFSRSLKHTVCKRELEKCGSAPNCGPNFREIQFTNDDRQYILDIHNYMRNRVALGLERRGPQPPASNMRAMNYNRQLEFVAQCWANACNGEPLIHDECRRTEHHAHVGQNLGFVNSSTPSVNIVKSIKDLILLWYDEVALFDGAWVLDTRDRGADFKVGHYTQLVWSESSEVGCAATYYTKNVDRVWYKVVFVCNYGPGGNYLGSPVYQIGIPTSNCPNGQKPNKFYKGLCGAITGVNLTSNDNFNVFNIL